MTTIVRDLSLRIQRGDRLGLIGRNGAGKSTLLKLILGQLAPDAGEVRLGTNLQVAYFDQMREQLDPEHTLLDTISPGSEWLQIGAERKHVMTYPADFLFPPQRANAPVKMLSGGERNRLLLARLFARPANVLVLDEPTNDLDIESLELLADTLQGYPGTLLLVSHDRVLLDNVVTQTLVAEHNGKWQEYAGGYSDWQSQRPVSSASAPTLVREGRERPQSTARNHAYIYWRAGTSAAPQAHSRPGTGHHPEDPECIRNTRGFRAPPGREIASAVEFFTSSEQGDRLDTLRCPTTSSGSAPPP